MTKEEFQATDPNKLLELINERTEMLEALRDIEQLAYTPGGFDQENLENAIAFARKAIAKAEGSNSTKEKLR